MTKTTSGVPDTTQLVTKLLSEGAKEFPHQWEQRVSGYKFCIHCNTWSGNTTHAGRECPVLLRAALDLTRQQLAEALDPTVRE